MPLDRCHPTPLGVHHGASPVAAIRRSSAIAIRRRVITAPLRRVPRVQTAISAAIQVRVFVTMGPVSVDVQILRRPFLTVRHPFEGIHRAGRCLVLR
jgi:hypothetical protein